MKYTSENHRRVRELLGMRGSGGAAAGILQKLGLPTINLNNWHPVTPSRKAFAVQLAIIERENLRKSRT